VGIIDPEKYDAFFSYAHSDNEARRNLITNFREALAPKIKHEITKKRQDLKTRDVFIFQDKENLEITGQTSDRLAPHVRKSWFLFVFMSEQYQNSAWCEKELDWFKDNFRGEEGEAIKHTIIVVLEKEALRGKWKSYLGADNEPLYMKFFDENSRKTFDFYSKRAIDNKSVIDQDVDDILDEIAAHVAKMALDELIAEEEAAQLNPPSVSPILGIGAGAKNQAPPSKADQLVITIGAVTSDLKGARSRLLEGLKNEEKIDARFLDLEDFERGEDVEKLVQGSALFVQPYSFHKVEFGLFGMPDGGHLRIQELLADVMEGERIPILWWYPEGEPAITKQDAARDVEPQNRHISFIENLRDRTTRGCLTDVVKEIQKRLGMEPGIERTQKLPTVMIESSPEDWGRRERIAKTMEELWSKSDGFKECGPLLTRGLPWKMLEDYVDCLRDCNGFVFVFGSKQPKSLFQQTLRLDSILKLNGWDAGRAVIAVPPEKAKGEDAFWRTLRFYDDGTLHEDDEERALRFLSRVHQAWRSNNQKQASAA